MQAMNVQCGISKPRRAHKPKTEAQVTGETLSTSNINAINTYASKFHVAYTWRYVWARYLKTCRGLERFKRLVAKNLRAEVVWRFRIAVRNNRRSYQEIMGQNPMPNEAMIRGLIMGTLKKSDIYGF